VRVKDIMQSEVTTLGLGDSLDVANDIMTLGRVRHLPVVTDEDRLVGVVTQRDLLKASIASVLDLSRRAERDWLKGIPVGLVMVKDVVTTSPERPLREAVELMIHRKIGCLPVVDGERLVGLVTETDCLKALAGLLPAGSA